jgi:hypothetical protein
MDAEESSSADCQWHPCLQLEGMCLSFDDVWFRTEQQCVDFIRREIIGKDMLP